MGSEKQLQSVENVAVSNWVLKRSVTKFERMGVLSKNGEFWCAGTGVLLLVEAPELRPLEAHRLGGSPRAPAVGRPVCLRVLN